MRRAKAEAEERQKMQRRVYLGGCKLLAVRAAERAAFWYTANLEGFGGADPFFSLDSMVRVCLEQRQLEKER